MDRETAVTAKRFANVLRQQMSVNQLILFGSRARGDNFVTSDFDFVLVSNDFAGVPFVKRASQLYELWHSTRDLEVLCYTPDEWRKLRDRRGILLNARKEGILIA
jgi:predicted nucleotidyltransferase